MFGFEFKHPSDWAVGRGLPSLRVDAQRYSVVQIDWFDSKNKSDRNFCEDYFMNTARPLAFDESPRCERFALEGISTPGVIDWKVTSGWANALFDDGLNTLSVSLGDSRPDGDYGPEVTRAFFRTFLSTFRLVESQEAAILTSCRSGKPTITSISPTFGPIGTEVEIRGCNFAGFEGDLDAGFIRNDDAAIPLYGGTWCRSCEEGEDKDGMFMKVTVHPYCESGHESGRYSGINSPCEPVEATPGIYKVYVTAWGKESDEVSFTVTK